MNNTRKITFVSLGIAINVVLGTLTDILQFSKLYLDTVGTIFTACILGPVYGAMSGGLTNIIQGIITNPKTMPFALVNIAVGLVVGYIAKKYEFNFKTALITGGILAVVAPLIGAPIAVYVFGGITGDGNDVIFTWLVKSGQKLMPAAFIPRVISNIIDKIASCIFVSFLLARLKPIIPRVKA